MVFTCKYSSVDLTLAPSISAVAIAPCAHCSINSRDLLQESTAGIITHRVVGARRLPQIAVHLRQLLEDQPQG